jgi:hypothetical protein
MTALAVALLLGLGGCASSSAQKTEDDNLDLFTSKAREKVYDTSSFTRSGVPNQTAPMTRPGSFTSFTP